jgi:hypothetical protein
MQQSFKTTLEQAYRIYDFKKIIVRLQHRYLADDSHRIDYANRSEQSRNYTANIALKF